MTAAVVKAEPKKAAGRPRRAAKAPATAPPPERTPAEPDEDCVAEPLTVNGVKVVDSHRPQNLPNAPFNYIKLTLADGSVRYQCFDCPDFIGGREEVRLHRKIVHPGRTDAHKIPQAVMQMTLSQLLSTAESAMSVGALVERIEAERDRYRSELAEITRKYNALTKALDKVGFAPKLEDE